MNTLRLFTGAIVFTLLFQQNLIAQNTVTVDTSISYQRITGWEVMGWMANFDTPWQIAHLDDWNDSVANVCADIGINRVRVEVRSGAENPVDYFTQYITGQISRPTWKAQIYNSINDNGNPAIVNDTGFHFSEPIYTIEKVAIPLKNAVNALGKKFYLNLCYVDFEWSGVPVPFEHRNYPAEYAEFMRACFDTIYNRFGFTPDGIEVILEPENSGWSNGSAGDTIGNVIAATGDTLAAHGYYPDFIAPSPTAASNTVPWTNDILAVPNAANYLTEISYHKYWNQNASDLQSICSLATANNLTSSMLEWWNDGNDQYALHRDLTLGCVSAWQSGIMAEVNSGANPNTTALMDIDDSDTANPVISENPNARYYRQYFKYIPTGAVRVDATVGGSHQVTAYKDTLNREIVVINAQYADSFSIAGLSDGTYGITYSTVSENGTQLPDAIIAGGNNLNVSIPNEGVITVYDKGTTTGLLTNQEIVNKIKIFPNPANDYFSFTYHGINGENFEIAIYNKLGQQVLQTHFDKVLPSSQYTVNTQKLLSGVYFVQFYERGRVQQTEKLIIGK